jgi:hypothetical protein
LQLVLIVLQWIAKLLISLRYCDALAYGIHSITAGKARNRLRQQKMYRKMLDEDLDAALLRLFHCFLHAAPQAVLQLMILIFHANQSDASSIQGKEYL